LMHTEDVSNLSDLIPPKTAEDYKNALLPYLFILDSFGNVFDLYGENKFWKISETINMNPNLTGNASPTLHDRDSIDIYLECNSIDGFLTADFDKLDEQNSKQRKEIQSFINPFIYTALRKKAITCLKDESNSAPIIHKIQTMLDDCLIKAKNDSSDPRYMRYKEAYLSVQRIINNL
jgi:hypothetical protein